MNGYCEIENAVDAITNRVASVTALTEQLEDIFPNDDIASFERILKSPILYQDWNLDKSGSCSSLDDYLTVSECTCTPVSRSSSYHTAPECEHSYSKPSWRKGNEDMNEMVEVVKTQKLRFSREGCTIDTEFVSRSTLDASSDSEEIKTKLFKKPVENALDDPEVGEPRKRLKAY